MKNLFLAGLLALIPVIAQAQYQDEDTILQPVKATQADSKTILGISCLISGLGFLAYGAKASYEQGQGVALAAGIVSETMAGTCLIKF